MTQRNPLYFFYLLIPFFCMLIIPSYTNNVTPPLISSYNDRIRPLLDAVDKLRKLKATDEGIQLPTIVVIGDQSSGKSSVLESLAGISLPRGHGICTRVPLIMCLQHHSNPEPVLYLEYMGKVIQTDEAHVSEAINSATQEIAGNGKGISNTPITLVVRKKGVPDLTMVDLPGITRVPVRGQPENVYEQIRDIIMEYITPEESIILNVLSATVDFSTCESIMMSQAVDKTGQRTLAVVTKPDKAPEGLLEKLTNDDVSIGLGYVCVRNRIGEETYEEAWLEEMRLFQSHPLLSRIDKSIVGVPVLAQKLVQIQANIISKTLPNIVKKIDEKLNVYGVELNNIPRGLSSMEEAMAVFMHIVGSVKESLRKILIRGEYEEYPDDTRMHCTARLNEMIGGFSKLMQSKENDVNNKSGSFLMEEIRVLEEAKGVGLPNFLSRWAFLTALQKKVKGISQTPVDFVTEVWGYIEGVVIKVGKGHSEKYPLLQSFSKRAAGNLISRMKDQSVARVKEIVQMEMYSDYTCNPDYLSVWNRLMLNQDKFMSIVEGKTDYWGAKVTGMELEGFGEVELEHLKDYKHLAKQAFDMKMRIESYWRIVLNRLVDSTALHLVFSIQNLVNKELEYEFVGELMGPYGGSADRMLEESPAVASKRDKLNKSIQVLKESKDVVSTILDKIADIESF
ncbi:dynamin-related protein 4C-like [Spinacia oleracea]|uniref:Dynamin-related protein 4C-like n=1 Tax=Spinacia oleracea TaxID=3562 RepID=A0A9R0KD62_SPIOL|nr:dynamin-related protein 4C-like [Spinacia oleracea]